MPLLWQYSFEMMISGARKGPTSVALIGHAHHYGFSGTFVFIRGALCYGTIYRVED